MLRTLAVMAVAALCLGSIAPARVAAASPVHTLSVSGAEVAMYPAFDPSVVRYGVTTTDATAGSVTVTASTSDPNGTIRVDGRPAPGGTATLTGLTSGDEISVFIKDSAGTEVHSLVYLPSGFPTMTVVADQPGVAPGDVLFTLSDFTHPHTYETAVDTNGVPVFVRSASAPTEDLKQLSNGNYSVARAGSSVPGKTGFEITELDKRFREITRYETAGGLKNTDGHDSILRPDGSRILIGYEPNSVTSKTDAVIQEVGADNNVVYTWNSKDHVDPALDGVGDPVDYAHINSIAMMADGDVLASFRHLSQVLKIAWSAHDGYARGDVIWRLGGRRSDFTFKDDPFAGGPCAQHTASELPDGHILLFDNGSAATAPNTPMCLDPNDRTGPTINRPLTRITEYALDTTVTPHTASLVWSWQPDPSRFALFAGSARRLGNGNTLIGWAAAREALATEVNPAGDVLWELKNDDGFFTYRAVKAVVPDVVRPVLDVVVPQPGALYALRRTVPSNFGCTDSGGSSLRSCDGTSASRASLDTSVAGTHRFTVRAQDGAGNVSATTREYHVGVQPDGLIRRYPVGSFVGGDVYGSAGQQVRQSISRAQHRVRASVRFENDGAGADRVLVQGTTGSRAFHVQYFAGGTDISRQVKAGTYRTARLLPGQAAVLSVVVTRSTASRAGDSRTIRVRGNSIARPLARDAVATVVRAIR